MTTYIKKVEEGSTIFIGLDIHLRQWHVTVRDTYQEKFSGSIDGNWASLEALLNRYPHAELMVAYEAGFSGYWLHDALQSYGASCLVVPPSLLPVEYGNHVKTDKRDSRKLAYLLSKGMLKHVWVPSEELRYHRQVFRRRRQLVQDRVRVQCRIKSELYYYGIPLEFRPGRWTGVFFERLKQIRFSNRWQEASFTQLLDQYASISLQIASQTRLLTELSRTEDYRHQVALLCSMPGIGLISAMEVLLELGDVGRFHRGDQLAAYVGLTPSQYSSGDKIRMGRITGIGKCHLRGTLVEAGWTLVRKDIGMRRIYDGIKQRAGGKRAIVAVARRALLCLRRMLLEKRPYRYQPIE